MINSAKRVCYAWEKYADEVKNMRRQLPKNVRQIGNVSDTSKIYVEDYVDTFFNQLCDKAGQTPVGAFLVGETVREKDEDYIYVYGALRMKRVEVKGKEIQIDDHTWKRACEQCKEYFGDAAILGWFLSVPGQALEVSSNMTKVHQKYFSKEKTLFVLKDSETKEEKYFLHKFRELLEWGGHYIYYEKNAEMQNYMIDTRKRNGVTPSEVFEDRATANFRTVIRERMEQNEKKQHSKFLYVASTFLVLVVFAIGITMMNNYDKMTGVQETLNVISNSVLNNKEEEKEPEEDLLDLEEEEPEILDEEEELEPDELGEDTSQGILEEEDIPEEDVPDLEQPEEEVNDIPTTENIYIVQKGDTLDTISKETYGDTSRVEEICKMNGLEDGNLIFIGQKLLLP